MLYRLEPIKKRSFHVNERTNSNNGKHWKTVFQFILLSERYSNILQAPYTACRVFMTNTKEHISGNELGKQGRLVRKPVSLIYLGLFTHFINLSATFILDDLVSYQRINNFGKEKQNGIVSTNAVSPICHSDSVRRAADWQQNKSPRKSEILAKEGRFPKTTKYNFWSSLMSKLREKYLLRWVYILFQFSIFEFLKHSFLTSNRSWNFL